jgi:hypothetical protein
MDMKSVVSFEVKKGEHVYSLCIPMGAPYGELYDVLYEMLEETVKLAQKATNNLKKEDKASDEKDCCQEKN